MSDLWLERDGEVLDLDGWGRPGTLTARLVEGLGFPSASGRWFAGAAHGSRWRGTRVLPRMVGLDVHIAGPDLNGSLARLGAALDVQSPSRLWVRATDGSVWWLNVVRAETADYQVGQGGSDRRRFVDVPIVLQSDGSPWWTAEEAVEHAIVAGGAGRGLIGAGRSLAKLILSQSQAFGDVTVENPGDAPASLRVVVTGPGTDIVLGLGGQEVEWGGTLTGGESLTFDFDAATVTDGTGANRYADIATGKGRFWQLPPGTSTVDVSMASVSSGSEIRLQWFPRRQAIL